MNAMSHRCSRIRARASHWRPTVGLVIAVLMLLTLPPHTSHAQQPGAEAGAQALARAQSLLRQLAQQKAEVDAELAKLRAEASRLKKDVAGTKASLEDTTTELVAAQRENSGVRAKLGSTEKGLAKTTAQLRDVVGKYKEQAAVLRATQADLADTQATLAATSAELADAEKKNLALYQLNKKILAEFEQEGPWDGLLRKEPFTGLKRVEIENLVQEYEYEMGAHVRDVNVEATTTPAAP